MSHSVLPSKIEGSKMPISDHSEALAPKTISPTVEELFKNT
jgi:hypothetical protein